MSETTANSDRYHLDRFVQAQQDTYDRAIAEIRRGRKQTHWMWYIFPQYEGLGFSPTSKRYAIKSLDEAQAYLSHPLLGPRLVECMEAVLQVQGRSAFEIFGSPDDKKLCSCATLFTLVSTPGSVFEQLLEQYFQGQRDRQTLHLLELASS